MSTQGRHQLEACYTPRFDRAVALAVRDFRRETRKETTVPYITHLFAVAALVGEAGGDEDQLIAAVLHDWLEDVPESTPEQLEAEFGPRVRRIVVALSDTTVIPKPPWLNRKTTYLEALRDEPAEVKLVSCADKLHNSLTLVRDLRLHGPTTMERFSGGAEGSLWYYASVAEALAHCWGHWLLDELRCEVAHMHHLVGYEVGAARPPMEPR